MVKIDALEYMKQISRIDARIETKQAECQRLFDIATSVTPIMQECVVSNSGGNGKVESTAVKIADLRNEINMDIDTLIDKRREINGLIEQLQSEKQYKVLYKRYFEGKTFEKISDEIGCSVRNAHRLHSKAIKNVEKLLEAKYNKGTPSAAKYDRGKPRYTKRNQ